MEAKLRWLILLLGAVLLASCAMASPDVPPGDYNISVQMSPLRYIVNGVPNPELTLTRGVTYTFAVPVSGHPFYITEDATGGPGGLAEEQTAGVTGSRAMQGSLTFTPGPSSPDELYYQCTIHINMGNKIHIIN